MYATAGSFRSVTRSSSPLRGAATTGSSPSSSTTSRVIIAPTRGSNSQEVTGPVVTAWGHHRPYEGQQPDIVLDLARADSLSLSPLRGAATSLPAGQPRRSTKRHHRPYQR